MKSNWMMMMSVISINGEKKNIQINEKKKLTRPLLAGEWTMNSQWWWWWWRRAINLVTFVLEAKKKLIQKTMINATNEQFAIYMTISGMKKKIQVKFEFTLHNGRVYVDIQHPANTHTHELYDEAADFFFLKKFFQI